MMRRRPRPLHPLRSAVASSPRRRLLLTAAASTGVVIGALAGSVPVAAAPESPPVAVESAPLLASSITGLQQGSRGAAVKELQQALIGAGVQVVGGADGIFGPMTKVAVERFQAVRGLAVTGTVDAATADALAGGSSTPTPTPTPGPGASTGGASDVVGLARGAEGPAVERLQRALREFGVWLPSISGRFDSSTERGLGQFQRWNGLPVTTSVNRATARALRLLGSSGSTPPPAPAPAPTPAPGTGNSYIGITTGSRGPLVAEIQRALMARGITVAGGADGIFGPKTKAALVAFQRANGLSPTGVIAQGDVASLGLGGAAPTPAPAPTANPYVGLKVGSTGSAVKELQQALIDAGVSVRGGADGIFGPATKQALASYQNAQGLAGAGTVDAATAQRLGLGSSDGPVPITTQQPGPSPAPAPDAGQGGTSNNPYVGLRRGDSGPLVKELQQALQRLGFVVIGGADGSFGPATERTLKAFQSVNAIPQTGVVTERGAAIMRLGSGPQGSGGGSPDIRMERFPVQGRCFFGDTWHAPRGGNRLHVGTDVIAAEGKLLYAVVDGTISKLYWDQPGALSGNGLRIAQDDGTYFTYLHMQGFAPGIDVGTKVKAGDVIGWVGNTGSSATPHLHFEIHPGGGAAINPYPYLKAIDDCANTTPQYQTSFDPGT